MSINGVQALVFDCGAGMKAGFAGEEAPRTLFPCIVGTCKDGVQKDDCFIGEEAQARREILSCTYPITYGIVTNWDAMEKIFHHTYNELQVVKEEHSILLTEAPLNPKAKRETMTQLMFETFKVPAMYLSTQAVLSLYITGRTTGVVLDIGEEVTHSVPIHEGFSLPYAIQKLEMGGREITEFLKKILIKKGYSCPSFSELNIVKEIKEKWSYVAFDFEEEILDDNSISYTLPDGNEITVGNERFICSEILFQPNLIGKEEIGIDKMCIQSIEKIGDLETRKELYNNIVLSGGTTMIPGITERLTKELTALRSDSIKNMNVVEPAERRYSSWLGGSIFASSSTFKNIWITKEEFEENGAAIVHRKCF